MSEPTQFHGGRVHLHAGDCLEILKTLAADSVDSVVTDPPYHLTSIVRRFGGEKSAAAKDYTGERENATGAYARASRGFMGKQWDGGDIAFRAELWAEVLRVLKPGGHLAAFSGSRTWHRMAVAIEDAGFEIRDTLMWVYGSGFPKNHDVSKAIDKALGAERAKVRVDAAQVRNPKATGSGRDGMEGATRPWIDAALSRGYHEAVSDEAVSDEAVSDEAVRWQGWGTALKPALEPICLARKPLAEKTVAANVLVHGTGAINVDGCRVPFAGTNDAAAAAAAAVGFAESRAKGTVKQSHSIGKESRDGVNQYDPFALAGRHPANLVHDGSPEVLAGFPETTSGTFSGHRNEPKTRGVYGSFALQDERGHLGDSGSAARFFYSAKAAADDRLASKHPTVKPVDLMRWLVRLITPPGGVTLDPFSGTGTTGHAALLEGFSAVLIEREAEYRADIARRMALVFAGPVERAVAKAKTPDDPHAGLALFEGVSK